MSIEMKVLDVDVFIMIVVVVDMGMISWVVDFVYCL